MGPPIPSAYPVHWTPLTNNFLSNNGLTSSSSFFLCNIGIAWLTLNCVTSRQAFLSGFQNTVGYYATISWFILTYQIKETNFLNCQTKTFSKISKYKPWSAGNKQPVEWKSRILFSFCLSSNFRRLSKNLLTAFPTPGVIKSVFKSATDFDWTNRDVFRCQFA